MGTPVTLQKPVYEKAMKNDWKGMVEYYEDSEEVNVLHPISVAKDSALHVAVQSMRKDPLGRLLDIAEFGFLAFRDLESNIIHPVLQGNVYGNTALHLAATVGNYEAVVLLVERYPDLVDKTNEYGETPLFTAASFGETNIVKYLAERPEQVVDEKLSKTHRVRRDGFSILHIAVQGEHFETALLLLGRDKSLAELTDKDGKTSLHLLANMPSAFESGYSMGVFKKLFYYCLPVEDCTLASMLNQRHNNYFGALKGLPVEDPTLAGLPVEDPTLTSTVISRCYNHWANFKDLIKWIYLSICKCLFNGWPIVKKVWDDKRKHVLALTLAKLLIERDDSCLVFVKVSESSTGVTPTLSYSIDIEQIEQGNNSTNVSEKGGSKSSTGVMPTSSHESTDTLEILRVQGNSSTNVSEKGGSNSNVKYIPTPLFIAIENGIREIVEATLAQNPQGVEHIDDNGRNILHVAIMHRREKIFNLVKEKSMKIARLNLGVDKYGYTLLHHAADTKHYIRGSKPGPALQLQEELQWFERVQEIVPSHFAMHRANNPKSTAWELFKDKHQKQLEHAQTWVKDTSQSCSTVAVLVATVVFAAAYTVPGGYEENKGTPIFLHSPYFLFFTIMDVISLAASLTSVVMFLSVLTSPFEIEDFRHSLPRKLMLGFTLLFFSVVTTMLTFGATVLLTVHLEQKLTTSLLTIAAFFPVLVFALMQFRLYIAFTGILKEFVKDIVEALPSCPIRSLYCKDKFD